MTEINKDLHIQSHHIKPEKHDHKEEFACEEFTPEGETFETNLGKDPKAVWGRSQVKIVKAPENLEDTKEVDEKVLEYVNYFMENPELCAFAMDICDDFIKKGCSTEEAMIKTARVISETEESLRS